MSLSVKSESFNVEGKLRYQFFEDDGSIAGGNAISLVNLTPDNLPTVNFMNHTGTISVNLPNGVNSAIVKISPAKPGPYSESVWFDNILITKEESMPIVSYFAPNVVSSTEYWPFGYPMKAVNPQEYRFGFNGMEKDPEITGQEGSHYTAAFWEYDTKIARRWNVDPVDKPWESSYLAFSGSPILLIDPKGDNTDWYRGTKSANLLWAEESSSEIDFNGEKFENIAKGDLLPVPYGSNEGQNLLISAHSTDEHSNTEWDSHVEMANNTNDLNGSVYAIANSSDELIKAFEVTTLNFGQVNDAFIRGHGYRAGINLGEYLGADVDNADFTLENGVDDFKNSQKAGKIQFANNAKVVFMVCNGDWLAEGFTNKTGVNSIGASGGTGPENSSGGFVTSGAGFYQYEKSDIKDGMVIKDLGLNVEFNF